MSAPYSLRRRLALRVLGLVAGGWVLAMAGALLVLRHETNETLDEALQHEARLLAGLVAAGHDLPAGGLSEDREMRVTGRGPAATVPWPDLPGPGAHEVAGWHIYRADTGDGRAVELGEPDADRRGELWESLQGVLVVMLPVALAVLVVIRWTLAGAMAPLRRLSAELAARARDDLSPVAAEGLPREMAPVAAALNAHLARITDLVAAERAFAANAAHELRTPLAAARAQAQLLAARAPDAEAQAGAARVVAALDRMAGLAERLLQLARAESGAALARGPVDLTRLIPLLLRDLSDVPGRPVRFDDGDQEDAVVAGDPDALAILLRNLIANAQGHGTGPVTLRLSPGPVLTLTNPVADGAAFATRRFEKGAGSEGSGLGLTIAETLARQSGVALTLTMAGGVAEARLDWRAAG